MQKYINKTLLLTEARMMYTDCHQIYVLIEGESDKVFFETLLPERHNISFRPVGGWQLVYDTICLAKQDNFSIIAGVIDKDFHEVLADGTVENDQLFFTDSNDIEMMLFLSEAFDKFLSVCANKEKIKKLGCRRIPILNAASYLGAFRAVSLQNHYNLCFDGFEIKTIIDKNTLAIDCKKMVSSITQRTCSRGEKLKIDSGKLLAQVEAFQKSHEAKLICNGHDVIDIIQISMCKYYASYSANYFCPQSLFESLLMGYSEKTFQESKLGKKLLTWIHINAEEI